MLKLERKERAYPVHSKVTPYSRSGLCMTLDRLENELPVNR